MAVTTTQIETERPEAAQTRVATWKAPLRYKTIPVTLWAGAEEPALDLHEYFQNTPMGRRRWQEIHIVRSEGVVQFIGDLGSAASFEGARTFEIVGGVLERRGNRVQFHRSDTTTVAEIRGIADELRYGDSESEYESERWSRPADANLVQRYMDRLQVLQDLKRHPGRQLI